MSQSTALTETETRILQVLQTLQKVRVDPTEEQLLKAAKLHSDLLLRMAIRYLKQRGVFIYTRRRPDGQEGYYIVEETLTGIGGIFVICGGVPLEFPPDLHGLNDATLTLRQKGQMLVVASDGEKPYAKRVIVKDFVNGAPLYRDLTPPAPEIEESIKHLINHRIA